MNALERQFLLAVERGDDSAVQDILKQKTDFNFNINCCDPLTRNALIIAIDKENIEMVKILIQAGIETGDAVLYAIDQNFVEAVEILLDHEEVLKQQGRPFSWQQPHENSSFSSDMTPLCIAAHRNNYEIIKLLLDRNFAPLPDPHDPCCNCDSCSRARNEDCLKYSRSRLNAYKALASPCLMALSSPDPLLSAFELCAKLEGLARMEPEYKQDYFKIRAQCQTFATALLDHTRKSKELEVLLNYSDLRLARLRLAIQYKQKTFCAHPNVQEYLTKMWYENLPGFRRKNPAAQYLQVILIGILFPVYSIAYLIAPNSQLGGYIKKPFIKFICHSASYITFLIVLMLASQRVEVFYNWNSVGKLFSTPSQPAKDTSIGKLKEIVSSSTHIINKRYLVTAPPIDYEKLLPPTLSLPQLKSDSKMHHLSSARSFESLVKIFEVVPASSKKRGAPPSPIEVVILMWVLSLIWAEIKQLKALGMNYYKADMWNTLDSVASGFYIATISLRLISYAQSDKLIDLPREDWDAYDPTLLSEGLFAAATIFSTLKLVYIFSLNPYLGPLQISLGRMIIDILRFSWIYMLVLFSFACGMNQLLWYYADLERHQCLNITNYSIEQYRAQVLEGQRLHQQLYNNNNSNFSSEGFFLNDQNSFLNNSSPIPIVSVEDLSKPPVTTDDSCKTWRYFSNVFESLQTLFWATFGLVDLGNFDLSGIKEYTRFWALLMFGCYCFINVVVVLNMLIAMMNHSYVKISQKSDIEWKFARTRLWMSYIDTGSTVPPPFNIIPSFKSIHKTIVYIHSKIVHVFKFIFRKVLSLFMPTNKRLKNSLQNSRQQQQQQASELLENHQMSGDESRVNHERNINRIASFNSDTCITFKTNYQNVIRLLVGRYLVHEQQLLERKRGLTEAKLNRWAKLNAFD